MSLARCQHCHRPISVRWRTCPWCRRWSGQPHVRDGERLDLELQGIAAVTIAMGVCLLVWPWAFVGTMTWLALGLALVAVSFLIAGGAMLVSARAFDVVIALWFVTMLVAAKAVLDGNPWLLPLPLLLVGALVARRMALRRRLRGAPSIVGFVPRPGLDVSRCEFCGARSVGVFAPVLVISTGVFAVKSYTSFHSVCARHARLRTLLPTVVTALLGWWSPFGVIWTVEALAQNAAFGLEADGALVAELDEDVRRGWRSWLPALGGVLGVFFGVLEAVGLIGKLLSWLA